VPDGQAVDPRQHFFGRRHGLDIGVLSCGQARLQLENRWTTQGFGGPFPRVA